MLNGYPEFLITITSENNNSELILVDVKTVEDAIIYAFGTRNIASSWEITAIESDDVQFSITLPVTFETYNNICDSRNALRSLVIGA